ncbi:hypothetical protein M097_0969 [Phocaeicola vulgatus str. 3775 SL(B) 10 (iv)]|uniref:Lipoprotein n=1 Tax=Phocaeicola vulgatus str. 3775 SL(B) 10 (iv) TaxID=1339350 RepID=A0A078RFK3_PHOVU|nr:hypothetical protein M097_0969 [Phocaeicola vulgatus str. 3775 SL(B) 10 (iv)]
MVSKASRFPALHPSISSVSFILLLSCYYMKIQERVKDCMETEVFLKINVKRR